MPGTDRGSAGRKLAPIALAALLLAACAQDLPAWPERSFSVASLRAIHDVRFPPGSAELGENERERLAGIVAGITPRQGTIVYVDTDGPEASARRRAVMTVLRQRPGLIVRPRAGNGGGKEGAVQLVVEHRMVMPASCIAADGTIPQTLPVGCANELNLARMVEDRADLFRGRSPGPAPASTAVEAAKSYLQLRDPEASAGGEPPTGRASAETGPVDRSRASSGDLLPRPMSPGEYDALPDELGPGPTFR
ncbi:MAG TPA: CpaD family pilus assembly lipoprotein [Alphaproteobacteria bacterium]|nr:CpaD family pilus assembly lipoprotein [Alphaproteobacteria bacterium]